MMKPTHQHHKGHYYHVIAINGEVAYAQEVYRDGGHDPHIQPVNVPLEELARVKWVAGSFQRDIPVTRDQFIQRWSSEGRHVYWLIETSEEFQQVEAFAELVKDMAGRKWDRLKG